MKDIQGRTQKAPRRARGAHTAPSQASRDYGFDGPAGVRETPSPDSIRVRAYERYLARGAEPGHEIEDWLAAERELAAGR